MVKTKATTEGAGGRSRAATLADVAALAGVVPMTASRAINGTGYVSTAVRERVMQAARELQYRPNIIARQLRGSRLNAVGVLLPDIANPFSAELMHGIKEVLEKAGFTLFLGTTESSVKQEQAAIQAFIDHRIDGLIVATHESKEGDAAIVAAVSQSIPVVLLGRRSEMRSVDWVAADDYQGGYDAAQHLASMGHARIGFIGCSLQGVPSLPRFAGFLDGLGAAGLKIDPRHAICGVDGPGWATESTGFDGMLALSKLKTRPTAVMARNDAAAIGALRAANVLKLRVPEDVAISGFDNIPSAAFQSPPLTTVEQPTREQGRIAARLLLERIHGDRQAQSQTVVMPCALIVRESTGIGSRA